MDFEVIFVKSRHRAICTLVVFSMPFGVTASSDTFGGLGAGSTMFWVDPQRDLAFVCLTTGVLEDSRNFERLARLSDLVLSAVTD